MNKLIQILKKSWLHLVGLLAGSIGGYLYWYYIGCSSGQCPLTSSVYSSMLFGAIFGFILFGIFDKKEK